jgi:hypothetical protein
MISIWQSLESTEYSARDAKNLGQWIMRCLKHPTADAVATCAYCGRGVCAECIQSPTGPRIVCSTECGAALARNDDALSQLSSVNQQLLQHSVRNARASAFYCYLCAGLSAAAGVVAWFMLPSPFLILFTGGCAVVLLLSGFWYGRVAKKRNS